MKEFTEKQLEIIRTALEIISEEGVKFANFRIIAKKLGVTEPAIYRHFDSKRDFIESLYVYIHRSFRQSLEDRFINSNGFKDHIYDLLLNIFEHLKQVRGVNFILFAYSIYKNDKYLLELIKKVMEDYRSKLIALLEEAKRKGEIADINSDIHSTIILGFTQAFVINCIILGRDISPQEYACEIMETYIKALGDKR